MFTPRIHSTLLAGLSVCLLVACRGAGSQAAPRERLATAPAPQAAAAAESNPSTPERPKVVVLGDSLTAGLGLLETEAFPAVLQRKADADGYDYEIDNAGVSGDTSAGGLRRLDWALQGNVRVLIVALGGNDGLRGLSVREMNENLSQIVQRAKQRGVAVILAGMEAPPNYGREYSTAFREVYRDVALKQHVLFIPFLLDNVAGRPDLNQPDGIHPNAEGARLVADQVWAVLRPLLDQITAAS